MSIRLPKTLIAGADDETSVAAAPSLSVTHAAVRRQMRIRPAPTAALLAESERGQVEAARVTLPPALPLGLVYFPVAQEVLVPVAGAPTRIAGLACRTEHPRIHVIAALRAALRCAVQRARAGMLGAGLDGVVQ